MRSGSAGYWRWVLVWTLLIAIVDLSAWAGILARDRLNGASDPVTSFIVGEGESGFANFGLAFIAGICAFAVLMVIFLPLLMRIAGIPLVDEEPDASP